MDFRDAWIFSPGRVVLPIRVPEKKKERRYTLKEVKEAYDPVIAELKERANMFRLEKAGLMEAAKILAERGKIDYKEFRSLTSQKAREFAKNEKFDLDKAQDKFLKKKE